MLFRAQPKFIEQLWPLVVFTPISFKSRLYCHAQHQMCRRVSSQAVSCNVPLSNTASSISQIVCCLHCSLMPPCAGHYFTLYLKLNFYSAKRKKRIPSSTASASFFHKSAIIQLQYVRATCSWFSYFTCFLYINLSSEFPNSQTPFAAKAPGEVISENDIPSPTLYKFNDIHEFIVPLCIPTIKKLN